MWCMNLLIATISPVSPFLASSTLPYVPSPSFLNTLYLSIVKQIRYPLVTLSLYFLTPVYPCYCSRLALLSFVYTPIALGRSLLGAHARRGRMEPQVDVLGQDEVRSIGVLKDPLNLNSARCVLLTLSSGQSRSNLSLAIMEYNIY